MDCSYKFKEGPYSIGVRTRSAADRSGFQAAFTIEHVPLNRPLTFVMHPVPGVFLTEADAYAAAVNGARQVIAGWNVLGPGNSNTAR